MIIEPPDLKTLSSVQTYEVYLLFDVPLQNIQRYEQNFDREFEAKCRKALIAYVDNEKIAFNEPF